MIHYFFIKDNVAIYNEIKIRNVVELLYNSQERNLYKLVKASLQHLQLTVYNNPKSIKESVSIPGKSVTVYQTLQTILSDHVPKVEDYNEKKKKFLLLSDKNKEFHNSLVKDICLLLSKYNEGIKNISTSNEDLRVLIYSNFYDSIIRIILMTDLFSFEVISSAFECLRTLVVDCLSVKLMIVKKNGQDLFLFNMILQKMWKLSKTNLDAVYSKNNIRLGLFFQHLISSVNWSREINTSLA